MYSPDKKQSKAKKEPDCSEIALVHGIVDYVRNLGTMKRQAMVSQWTSVVTPKETSMVFSVLAKVFDEYTPQQVAKKPARKKDEVQRISLPLRSLFLVPRSFSLVHCSQLHLSFISSIACTGPVPSSSSLGHSRDRRRDSPCDGRPDEHPRPAFRGRPRHH